MSVVSLLVLRNSLGGSFKVEISSGDLFLFRIQVQKCFSEYKTLRLNNIAAECVKFYQRLSSRTPSSYFNNI